MPKHYQRFIFALVVLGASFVQAAPAMAGVIVNHNETFLLDS
jgi:hypothetical protein